MIEERTCPDCQGHGIVFVEGLGDDKCEMCDGHGTIERPCGNEKLTREELNRE
jgi:DnaJ-class molecular chaperone